MKKHTLNGTIEHLGIHDIHAVMQLEKTCFTYHWTEQQFLLGLEKNAFSILGWRHNGELVGYVAFSMIAGEMEILNLGVLHAFRRKGIGRKLLSAVLKKCHEKKMDKGFLDVKESNAPAIALYEQFGFKCVGIRKQYYPDTKENALLYALDFND